MLVYNGEEGRWKKEMASLLPQVAWAVCVAHGTLVGEQRWPQVQGGLPCSLPVLPTWLCTSYRQPFKNISCPDALMSVVLLQNNQGEGRGGHR